MKRLFATQFPIQESTSLDELLALEKKWISGSDYSVIKLKDLEALQKNDDSVKIRDDVVKLNLAETSSYSAIGLTYKKVEPNKEIYQSTVVGRKSRTNFWVSFILDFYSPSLKVKETECYKPYLIKQIFDEIGGGRDGDLDISDEPIYLREGDEAFVSEILSGKSKTIMPILYMSRNKNALCSLSPGTLAKDLSGIANVLVEPASTSFSFNLKDLIQGKNVFDGAIGVYWPDGSGRYFWLAKNLVSGKSEEEIYNTITDALIPRSLQRTLTIENILDISHTKKLEDFKKELERKAESTPAKTPEESVVVKEMREYAGLQNEEIKRLTEKNSELEKKNDELESKSSRFPTKTVYEGGVIAALEDDELYSGEVRNIVLETLKDKTGCISDMTRRKKILERIVASNPNEAEKTVEGMKAEIKRLLNGFVHLTAPIKKGFERMGFAISDDGKHYKIYVDGDEGGVCSTLPKSGGDKIHGGRNAASDIIRTFF